MVHTCWAGRSQNYRLVTQGPSDTIGAQTDSKQARGTRCRVAGHLRKDHMLLAEATAKASVPGLEGMKGKVLGPQLLQEGEPQGFGALCF